MPPRWPFVRKSASNTGATGESGPLAEPELLWRHDAGARVFGTPLVSDQHVFVATCAQTHHDAGCVVAIDRRTGDRVWMSAGDATEVRGTPALVNGQLYLVDLDGRAFVLDADDGTVRRSESTPTPPADGVCPVGDDEQLFLTPWFLDARDTDEFDPSWRDEGPLTVEDPVAVDDAAVVTGAYSTTGEEVYVGTDDAGTPSFVTVAEPFVVAFDPETGDELWRRHVGGLPRAPAIRDGRVVVATAGSDPQGKRFGRVTACSDDQPVPEVEPADYRTFGTIHALEPSSGNELWSTNVDSPVRTMPAAGGSVACVGTYDGRLIAFDAATGDHLWCERVNEDSSVLSSPTTAEDVVYVGSDDEHLLALDPTTGDELWRYPTDAAVDANPSVVDGVVYAADNSGTVYALGRA